MKPINKKELYENLRGFLQAKGIELKDGSYTQRIQKGCHLLADAVNLTQGGIEKAKTTIDKKLEQMRQVIHEKTAPKPAPAAPAPEPPPTQGPRKAPKAAAKKTAARRRKPPARARAARK